MVTWLSNLPSAWARTTPRPACGGLGRRGSGSFAVLGALGAALLLTSLGCGKETKRAKKRGFDEPMAANLKDLGKPSVDLIEEKAAAQEAAKKKKKNKKATKAGPGLALPKPDEFTERDFTESEQESRDPFRNLLVKEPTKAPVEVIQPGDVVFLKDYPLAELKVTGIVGGTRRFAMVMDPRTGRTTILQKRDRVAKERALIFEINRDHLLLLVPRLRPNKDDPYERKAVYVDEQRKIVDIGSDALRPDESGIRFSSSRRRALRSTRPKEP